MDSVNLCSLVKISDTELIYDVEQGTDTRTYSYFIYNSETHTSRLLLTTQYHVETESGKILQRARRVGDEIYVLVQTVDGTTRSNVLERYSMDGEPMGTIPVPEAMNPYVNSGGEAYYISDFDVRGDLYSFNAAGDVFFTRMDGVYEKQTLERGWGTLYPESDPRYLIETDLYENSRMFVTDLETENDRMPF